MQTVLVKTSVEVNGNSSDIFLTAVRITEGSTVKNTIYTVFASVFTYLFMDVSQQNFFNNGMWGIAEPNHPLLNDKDHYAQIGSVSVQNILMNNINDVSESPHDFGTKNVVLRIHRCYDNDFAAMQQEYELSVLDDFYIMLKPFISTKSPKLESLGYAQAVDNGDFIALYTSLVDYKVSPQ